MDALEEMLETLGENNEEMDEEDRLTCLSFSCFALGFLCGVALKLI